MITTILTLVMRVSAGPLAPAANGQMQCYHPDRIRRTCLSLVRYHRRPDGGYDNEATVLVTSTPAVVLTTVTPVSIDNATICQTIRRRDVQAGNVQINGRRLAGDQLNAERERLATMMAFSFGRRVCTTFAVSGDTLSTAITIDDHRLPSPGEPVLWVAAVDGYRVAP